LDALCERFAVDNAHRSVHGALLDAQLLAEVYLTMTRGQEYAHDRHGAGPDRARRCESGGDGRCLSRAAILILAPTADELAAHREYMAMLDRETAGRSASGSAWSRRRSPLAVLQPLPA
jgi:DNA polymerase-3 subunit epsilon